MKKNDKFDLKVNYDTASAAKLNEVDEKLVEYMRKKGEKNAADRIERLVAAAQPKASTPPKPNPYTEKLLKVNQGILAVLEDMYDAMYDEQNTKIRMPTKAAAASTLVINNTYAAPVQTGAGAGFGFGLPGLDLPNKRKLSAEDKKKKAEERKKKKEEARKKKEEARRKKEEARKKAEAKRKADENKKRQAEEKSRKAEEERQRKQQKADEDARRKKAESDAKKADGDAKKAEKGKPTQKSQPKTQPSTKPAEAPKKPTQTKTKAPAPEKFKQIPKGGPLSEKGIAKKAAQTAAKTATKETGKQVAKGVLKNTGKQALKAIPGIGLVAGAAFAVADAYDGYKNAASLLGVNEADLDVGDKSAAAAGSVISGLTFGLADSADTAKGLNRLFGGDETVEKFEKMGILDHNSWGDSDILDWDKVNKLSSQEIQQLQAIDDFSDKDNTQLKLAYEMRAGAEAAGVQLEQSVEALKSVGGEEIIKASPTQVQAVVNKPVTSPIKPMTAQEALSNLGEKRGSLGPGELTPTNQLKSTLKSKPSDVITVQDAKQALAGLGESRGSMGPGEMAPTDSWTKSTTKPLEITVSGSKMTPLPPGKTISMEQTAAQAIKDLGESRGSLGPGETAPTDSWTKSTATPLSSNVSSSKMTPLAPGETISMEQTGAEAIKDLGESRGSMGPGELNTTASIRKKLEELNKKYAAAKAEADAKKKAHLDFQQSKKDVAYEDITEADHEKLHKLRKEKNKAYKKRNKLKRQLNQLRRQSGQEAIDALGESRGSMGPGEMTPTPAAKATAEKPKDFYDPNGKTGEDLYNNMEGVTTGEDLYKQMPMFGPSTKSPDAVPPDMPTIVIETNKPDPEQVKGGMNFLLQQLSNNPEAFIGKPEAIKKLSDEAAKKMGVDPNTPSTKGSTPSQIDKSIKEGAIDKNSQSLMNNKKSFELFKGMASNIAPNVNINNTNAVAKPKVDPARLLSLFS